ncbi:MAG: SsrA-binding protein SmpB [Patescibacteria group bacterium]
MDFAFNKFATSGYQLLDKYQAGLVLTGAEVKSTRQNGLSLRQAYVSVNYSPKPEFYLMKAKISPYRFAPRTDHYDPEKPRKLLLQKAEMRTLLGKLEQKGLTIIPLRVYNNRNFIKVEIALAKGKKQFEKKEDLKKKAVDKEIRTRLKYQ